MRQLGELGKSAEKFKAAGAEVIAVFREEKKEVEGLKAIVEKTSTPFTLALDNGKKKTSRYSAGNREFTGYVINSKGVITKIFQGDLRNRAKSAELLEALGAKKEMTDATEGSATKEAAKGSETKATTQGSSTKGSSKK